jgi:WD40 repeat protein
MLAWSEPAIFGVHLRVLQTSLGYEHAQLHTSAVQQIRYDPRGRLVTASADGALKLWTLGYAGRLEETAVGRGAWGEVRAVAVHPAGNWVVSGHADGKVRIWELAEPPQRKLLETGRSQQAAFVGSQRCLVNDNGLRDFSRGWEGAATAFPIAAITALAVHPAGRRFAFGNENGALAVGDLERPGAVVSCVGHRQRINFLASSPDGKHLASASADGTVRLWNWETGSGSRTIEPGLGALHGMAWGAGNRSLVVVGDRGAAVWDVDRPAKGRTIGRPSSRADSVAAFADLVALSGPDGTVEVSELPTGRRRHTLRGHTATVSALEFSPDGSLLASGAADGSIRLWQTATGAEAGVFQHSGLVASFLAFDPRGRYLASDSTHACLIWEIRSKSPAVQFNDPGLHARFVADGSAVLVGTRAGSILRCTSGEIEQARAGARGATELSSSQFVPVDLSTTVVQGGHNGTVWGIAASPDGRWIATASHDQTVKLWDAQTLKLVRTLEGHQAVVWCVAFSPDSKYLASGSAEAGEGAVTVWDVATGRAHRRFHGHRGLVLGLAFHPERPWVASSSIDGSVCLWDVDAGRALGLLHQFDRGVYSVAFRPAGRCLAASCLDARVAVWDLAEPLSGAAPPSRFLAGHTAAVYCVGFSADGRYLASGSEQGGIMLWDAQTFAPITTLRGGTGQIRNIAFSRDGALLAGAAYVTPTIVWDLNLLRHTLAEMNLDW